MSVEIHERLAFIERELRLEITELRDWAKEDRRDAKCADQDERRRLNARADAYLYAADQMQRILKGRTAAEELAKRLLK